MLAAAQASASLGFMALSLINSYEDLLLHLHFLLFCYSLIYFLALSVYLNKSEEFARGQQLCVSDLIKRMLV